MLKGTDPQGGQPLEWALIRPQPQNLEQVWPLLRLDTKYGVTKVNMCNVKVP